MFAFANQQEDFEREILLPDYFTNKELHFTGSLTAACNAETVEEFASEKVARAHHERALRSSQQQRPGLKCEKPIDMLRSECGNDKCADCGAA
ncbi:unnamed protein product [Ilex paraguariensis]|uniref:Uncharacterized protein n=1 Tax=Ilex paraguariensis TaxID=185542 RepID=A0ABC8U5I4_9AQUA